MRRLLAAAAVLLAAACSSPRPCTQALCPLPSDGAYRVRGWTGSVTVSSGVPVVPIVSDATVEILSGKVAFSNDKAIVVASSGATFLFTVSSGPVAVPSLMVSAGDVSVALSSTAAVSPVPLAAPYFLPVAKKK
jgi:hypothetical protein